MRREANAWQTPDYTLEALITHFVSGPEGRDLPVTLLTAGAIVVGRLTSPTRWHGVVRERRSGVSGLDFGAHLPLAEVLRLKDQLSDLLQTMGLAERDYSGAAITRYFLLDATLHAPGADRSANPPRRPWIVLARQVIGWTLGDATAI